MFERVVLEAHAARDRRSLVTPEGIDLSLGLATAGQRIGAFALDLLFMIVALVSLTLLLASVARSALGSGSSVTFALVLALWQLGFFFIRNFYFILFEGGRRAATFGKRIMGLRVVARSGERLTLESVIARNLMREIEVFLPLMFVLQALFQLGGGSDGLLLIAGSLWVLLFLLFPLINRDRLRVGDLLAGTWVVSIPKRRLGWDLVDEARPALAFTPEQLDAYGVYELQTLERVLRERQWETIEVVARTIRYKIGYWEPVADFDFLSAYYAAVRSHMERGLLFGKRRADKFDRGISS
jgi:uncharacterized RDD family membrane protein YckC